MSEDKNGGVHVYYIKRRDFFEERRMTVTR